MNPDLGLEKVIDTEFTSFLCLIAGLIGMINSAREIVKLRNSYQPDKPVIFLRVVHKAPVYKDFDGGWS